MLLLRTQRIKQQSRKRTSLRLNHRILPPPRHTLYNTSRTLHLRNHSPALQRLVQQLRLIGVWEKLRRTVAGPTYITHNSTTRLDRIYTSDSLRNELQTTDIHVCSFSDHKIVTLRICLPSLGREPGRGFWTLRPHFLTNDNVEGFKARWQFWTRQRRNYPSWMTTGVASYCYLVGHHLAQEQ